MVLFKWVMKKEDQNLFGTPSEADWDEIEEGIKRLVAHPIWYADFDISPEMGDVRDALSKTSSSRTCSRRLALPSATCWKAKRMTASNWRGPASN